MKAYGAEDRVGKVQKKTKSEAGAKRAQRKRARRESGETVTAEVVWVNPNHYVDVRERVGSLRAVLSELRANAENLIAGGLPHLSRRDFAIAVRDRADAALIADATEKRST